MRKCNGFITTASAVLAVAAGCQRKAAEVPAERAPDERTLNTLMIHAAQEQNARNAIVAERAIYGHHFQPASPELNDLGLRQVRTLADAFYDTPVQVNVSRGDAADDLYRRRLDAVRAAFAHRGINPAKVTLNDGLPAGPGIASEMIWQSYISNPDGGSDSPDSSASSSSSSSSSGSRSSGGTRSNSSSTPRRSM